LNLKERAAINRNIGFWILEGIYNMNHSQEWTFLYSVIHFNCTIARIKKKPI
jgi:hypothetical protein